jgi:hypothetical protein
MRGDGHCAVSLEERDEGSDVFFERALETADVSGELDGFEPSSIEAVFAEDELQPMGRVGPILPGGHQMRPAACSA